MWSSCLSVLNAKENSTKRQEVSILSPLAATLVLWTKNFYKQAPDQTTRPKSLQVTGLMHINLWASLCIFYSIIL